MQRLATPWCFLGPSGSGKATQARAWIEAAYGVRMDYPLEQRTFPVGDGYEATVLASPYHFEIDIPNLSMQDKQIIGELLVMFLSSGDVLNATHGRKLVILRRAHCLSLPAAIRVRAVLQQYVFPAGAAGMIWMTAREMTGALALLEDGFVTVPVPRMRVDAWCQNEAIPASYRTAEAWDRLEGHPERAEAMAAFFPEGSPVWPRRIQDFYDEMVGAMMVGAASGSSPTLDTVIWIRRRIYDALSFCQTGPEIVDSCAAALARYYTTHSDAPTDILWEVMESLAQSEPHTSYRTPLSLEWAVLNMYDVMRRWWRGKTGAPVNGVCRTDSVECASITQVALPTVPTIPQAPAPVPVPTTVTAPAKRRPAARKKGNA